MRNLLNFILKYNYWFFFILLEIISFTLLFRFNQFQGSAFFTTANAIAGSVYKASSEVTSYFHLKDINDRLTDRNIRLEQQIAALRYTLKIKGDSLQPIDSVSRKLFRNLSMVKADVIDNSINKRNNYLTLDKGEVDGVRPEMGVIDGRGVVGIVYLVSAHYSVVLPILNSKTSISCKIRDHDYYGFLHWDGKDPLHANLEDIPRYARCKKGDVVITSGYSAVFPQGIFVGIVENIYNSVDGMSYQLRIRLSTDFSRLTTVRIISNGEVKEIQALKKQVEEGEETNK